MDLQEEDESPAIRNLKVHQMDVTTAFLNGDLEEKIYMEQPEGFTTPRQEGKARYSSITDGLMYLIKYTRPDLPYAVSRLRRYPAVIEGYSDANWISNIKDSRSTSGYVFTIGGGAISWKSSKKMVISIPQWSQNLSP
nr:retrotransposon-related protein [Tanacetum cinerariifolium]